MTLRSETVAPEQNLDSAPCSGLVESNFALAEIGPESVRGHRLPSHPLSLDLWGGMDLATPGAIDHELHEVRSAVGAA
jgi:hypothetical protein